MRLQLCRLTSQKIITFDLSATLGHGGEARIYAVPQDDSLVAKVYHNPTEVHAPKLKAMLANPPENPMASQGHISIAWPVDLLKTVDGSDRAERSAKSDRIIGFLMPRVKGMHSMLDFYNPKTRRQRCPFFNYLYLHRTARNLAAAFGALHAKGYCIGDVNESNILVSDTALVTLVDTDSFQVREPNNDVVYRCQVGKPEFTPPELQGKSFALVDRTPEHDLFGLAVLIFQLLMEGTHPFSGIYQGKGEPPSYQERIAAGHFTYSIGRRVPYIATPVSPPLEILHPSLRQLFVRCFEEGHNNPKMRPSAQNWQTALKEAENALVTCSTNKQHRYGEHLSSCPWCERTIKLGGRDPFPSWQAVQNGQHLQPLKPKPRRVIPHRTPRPLTPYRSTTTRPISLYPTISTKRKRKKHSPVMVGLFTIGVLGLFQGLIIVNDIKFSPKISATLSRTTNTNQPQADKGNNLVTYNSQGNTDYKLGNYKGAIDNYNKALRLNPKDAQAYLNRGNARYHNAQYSTDPDVEYKAAIADFNQVLYLNPNNTKAYFSRGNVHYDMAQSSSNPDAQYKAAIGDFNQVLRLNPKDAKAYVKRGMIHHKLAQYSTYPDRELHAALLEFNQALQQNPQDGEAYLQRGIVRSQLKQYSPSNSKNLAAIQDLQKAAKIFLDQGDIKQYHLALNNICAELENNCPSVLQNPEKFILSAPDSIQS